jgi:hypothetical protein
MARQQRRSRHAQLDELRQQAAAERMKLRELETNLAAAELDVEQQSRAIADGYAAEDERAVAEARHAEEQAVAKVRELQHQVDGAGIRVERAQQQLDSYERDHARDLLAEREQSANTVTAELTHAVQQTLMLANAYVAERQQVDRLVAAAGATPRADGPAPQHPWEQALKTLQRAFEETPEIAPPLPSWAGVEQQQQRDRSHRLLQLRRSDRLTDAERAELEELREPATMLEQQ